MDDGFQFFELIFLAMVAGFIALRLYSVLGRRTGEEQRPRNEFDPNLRNEHGKADQKVVSLPSRREQNNRRSTAAEIEHENPEIRDGLMQIRDADPTFDVEVFLNGSTAAYELIVASFAKGDMETLQSLLSDEVLENFSDAIKAREKAGQTLVSRVETIDKAEIEDAALNDQVAEITVRFESKLIYGVKDSEHRVIEGDVTEAMPVTESWTFARNVNNRDPNWVLTATESKSDPQ